MHGRLIDADALGIGYANPDMFPGRNRLYAEGWNQAIKILMKSPTVDAVPVRHGRWIEQEKYTFGVMYDCSICDNRILDNGHSWNYCPNCGAKMDGKDDFDVND